MRGQFIYAHVCGSGTVALRDGTSLGSGNRWAQWLAAGACGDIQMTVEIGLVGETCSHHLTVSSGLDHVCSVADPTVSEGRVEDAAPPRGVRI
jgi:hypothetical protein